MPQALGEVQPETARLGLHGKLHFPRTPAPPWEGGMHSCLHAMGGVSPVERDRNAHHASQKKPSGLSALQEVCTPRREGRNEESLSGNLPKPSAPGLLTE